MTNFYPIFLDLKGRRCVVIGGGAVAERKVGGLLEAGARVRVVSPALTDGLRHLAEQGIIDFVNRDYKEGDLEGALLAVAATDAPAVNQAIRAEASERGVLLNAVDDPAHCDFIAPSVVRRGEVAIAIATGGLSPALSRKLRRELEKVIGPEYGELAELMAEVRAELKENEQKVAAERWQEALDGDVLTLLRRGERVAAREHLLANLLENTTRQGVVSGLGAAQNGRKPGPGDRKGLD